MAQVSVSDTKVLILICLQKCCHDKRHSTKKLAWDGAEGVDKPFRLEDLGRCLVPHARMRQQYSVRGLCCWL